MWTVIVLLIKLLIVHNIKQPEVLLSLVLYDLLLLALLHIMVHKLINYCLLHVRNVEQPVGLATSCLTIPERKHVLHTRTMHVQH